MDFIRQAHITHGCVIFVENEELQIRECLLMCLSEIFKTNCFVT